MKHFWLALAACALMMAACGGDDAAIVVDGGDKHFRADTAIVSYTVGGWQVEHTPMHTRASINEVGMTDLWVFVYRDDAIIQQIHQQTGDDGFGSVELRLAYGRYKVCFVASRGAGASVSTDAGIIAWDKPSDTMWLADSLVADASTSASSEVDLIRVVGRVKIKINDVVPNNAASLVFSPSHWYYGLNILTGDAVGDDAQERIVSIPDSYKGGTNLAASFFTICGAEPMAIDAEVSLRDDAETYLGSVTLHDIEIQRNISTTYSGNILDASSRMTATSTDEWTEKEVNW